jgi:hypothetical protein
VVVARGGYDVTARADGYAPVTLRGLPLTANLTRDLRLHPAARLDGAWWSAAAGPWRRRRCGCSGGASPWRARPSDEGGGFAFTGLEPGSYDVIAAKPPLAGRTPAPVDVTVAAQAAVVVEVAPRPALRGRVLSAARQPVAGAEIRAGSSPRPTDAPHHAHVRPRRPLRAPGILPGDYWLWTSAAGRRPTAAWSPWSTSIARWRSSSSRPPW